MITVRAKFICVSKEHDRNVDEEGSVVLEAVINGSEENKEFFRYTPSGRIRIGIINKTAFQRFEPGTEYYVDFTKAEA